MTYQEKLKDPRWQRKRLEILCRDKHTCQECKGPYTDLQVHHKYYKRNAEPWQYKNDALVTLCDNCHRQLHYYLNGFDKDWLKIFKGVFFEHYGKEYIGFRCI